MQALIIYDDLFFFVLKVHVEKEIELVKSHLISHSDTASPKIRFIERAAQAQVSTQ